MNLNLTMWKKVGAPDMSERYDVVKRSPDNFHDDYTPPWIEVEEMPTVINFTKGERLIKYQKQMEIKKLLEILVCQ